MKKTILMRIGLAGLLGLAVLLTWPRPITSEINIPYEEETEIAEIEKNPSLLVEAVSEEIYEKEELEELIKENKDKINKIEQIKELLKGLDSQEETLKILQEEEEEILINQEKYASLYEGILEKEKWEKKRSEFPNLTTVWLFFKELGYSDYAIAGICGNLLQETTGSAMARDIRPNAKSTSGSYGICQWQGGRLNTLYLTYGEIPSLEAQLNFICFEIESFILTFTGYDIERFKNISNIEEATKVFFIGYELCSKDSAEISYYWDTLGNNCRAVFAQAVYEYYSN